MKKIMIILLLFAVSVGSGYAMDIKTAPLENFQKRKHKHKHKHLRLHHPRPPRGPHPRPHFRLPPHPPLPPHP